MDLTAGIRATPDAVALDDVVLRLDDSTLSGALAVVIGARPRLTLDVALDRIDLDAYLPSAPAAGETAGDPLAALAPLEAFDAELAATVGALTVGGRRLTGVSVAATLAGGVLELRELRVADAAGLSASATARITDLATGPAVTATYRLHADDLASVVALADPAAAARAAGLGGFDAEGRLSASPEMLELAADAAFAGATATLEATLSLDGQAPIDARLRLDAAEPSGLLRLAGLAPPAGLGALAATLEAKGDAQRASLDADIRLAGGRLRLAASFADLSGAPRYGIDVTVEHPSLARLMRMAAADYRPAGGDDLGAFALRGKLQGGPEAIVLSDLAATIGTVDLAGSAELMLDGPVPRLVATLTSRRADLRDLLPARRRGEAARAGGDKVFSRDPLPLDALRRIDADLRIRAGRVILPRLALRDLALDVSLSGGHLTVLPLQARIGGGTLDGGIDLRPVGTGAAALSATVSVARLDLGKLLEDLQVTDILEGKLDVDLDVSGRGGSVAELMAGLDGRTSVVMGKGRIDSKYVDLAGADLGSAVTRILDPFSAGAGYTEVNCFVSRFDIARGLATSTALVFDTDDMTVVGEGTVNLATERLDLSLEPSAKQTAANIGFSLGELVKALRLGGTLAKPRVVIDSTGSVIALSKALGGVVLFGPAGIAAALLSGGSGDGNACVAALDAAERGVPVSDTRQREQEPQGTIEKTKKKIDKVIEELGGNLLKGLFGN